MIRNPDPKEPFSALVFKVITDPTGMGKLAFFRVLRQGHQGESVLNKHQGQARRMARLYQMHANKRESITEVGAGNIGVAQGLKGIHHR